MMMNSVSSNLKLVERERQSGGKDSTPPTVGMKELLLLQHLACAKGLRQPRIERGAAEDPEWEPAILPLNHWRSLNLVLGHSGVDQDELGQGDSDRNYWHQVLGGCYIIQSTVSTSVF